MSKTRQILFFSLFTLASFAARGQFAAKDRTLSGSLNINFQRNMSKTNAEQREHFQVRFNPQMSFFTSAHFALGFGLDAQFSTDNYTQKGFSHDKSKNNSFKFDPQLFGQYYYTFSEKWYASARLQIMPISVAFSQWSALYSTGQTFNSKYIYQKNNQISASLTPLIGYRASKHWLIEGQFGSLTLSTNRSSGYQVFYVDGQLKPTLFNFRGIYLWSKTPPSVSKSK